MDLGEFVSLSDGAPSTGRSTPLHRPARTISAPKQSIADLGEFVSLSDFGGSSRSLPEQQSTVLGDPWVEEEQEGERR